MRRPLPGGPLRLKALPLRLLRLPPERPAPLLEEQALPPPPRRVHVGHPTGLAHTAQRCARGAGHLRGGGRQPLLQRLVRGRHAAKPSKAFPLVAELQRRDRHGLPSAHERLKRGRRAEMAGESEGSSLLEAQNVRFPNKNR